MGTELGLAKIFSEVAAKYGVFIGLLVALAFCFIIVLGYYFKARIDIMRREAVAKEEQTKTVSAASAKMNDSLVAELKVQREQTNKFITNHFEHDKEERQHLAKILTDISVKDQAQVDALHAIKTEIDQHRAEEAGRAGNIHKKLEAIHLEIMDVKRD